MYFLPQLESSLNIRAISDCVCWWWAINGKHVVEMIRERIQDPWNGFLNLMRYALRFSRSLPGRMELEGDAPQHCLANRCLQLHLHLQDAALMKAINFLSNLFKISEVFQQATVLVVTKFRLLRSNTKWYILLFYCVYREFTCFLRMWEFFTNNWS